tara:strand:+ start:284 stop:802 length:519 start_codon:yes stop_codon:yes gene_type:complete
MSYCKTVETPFNRDSYEVKKAKKTSLQHGRQMWGASKPKTTKVKIKNVYKTRGKKYCDSWGWPMYEIETNKGVYISAYGPDYEADNEFRVEMMRKNQNNGTVALGKLSGGGKEVFWDKKKYRKNKIEVVTGPSDRVPDWTWIYFIHGNDTKKDKVKSKKSYDINLDSDEPMI